MFNRGFNSNQPKLSFDSIVIGRRLTLINDQPLDPFEAIDDDAGIYGDVTFQLASTSDDHINFELVKLNRKQSELRVTRDIEERTYIVGLIMLLSGCFILFKLILPSVQRISFRWRQRE